MGGLAGAIEGDDDGEADRDFGGSDGDDEEDQDLRVVIGEAIVADGESAKRRRARGWPRSASAPGT